MSRFDQLPRGKPNSDEHSGTQGRQVWMNPATLAQSSAWQFGSGKLFLGGLASGELIGFADDRHIMTVAGSRAGKGVSVIIPTLLTYEGSMLVLDPKGENANETACRRGNGEGIEAGGLGHEVFVIDPYGAADDVPDHYRADFNPIALLDPNAKTFIDDCLNISDALVMTTGKESTMFFDDTARVILQAFIAWATVLPDPADRNLATVHRLLNQGEKDFDKTLDAMDEDDKIAWGVPSRMAQRLAGMDGEELNKVMSSVRQHISFLESPAMADCLRGTHRLPDLRSWKMGGQTIYLCLPATRIAHNARFFRLFINQLIQESEYNKALPDLRAVMMLDEMHTLGHMKTLQTAAALIAGFGIKIWSIWQDFNQLKAIYGDHWETFVGNASILQSFGLTDQTTTKYISDQLGNTTATTKSLSQVSKEQAAGGFTGSSFSAPSHPLLLPEEIAFHFARQRFATLVKYAGASPIYLERITYYDHPYFRPMIRKAHA